jgi:hypothetical protein
MKTIEPRFCRLTDPSKWFDYAEGVLKNDEITNPMVIEPFMIATAIMFESFEIHEQ